MLEGWTKVMSESRWSVVLADISYVRDVGNSYKNNLTEMRKSRERVNGDKWMGMKIWNFVLTLLIFKYLLEA